MIRHLLQIALITILALACMFYPFMPGTHDSLAVTVSMMAQALGFAGLLLVPIGALWLIYELMNRAEVPDSGPRNHKGHWFGLAALAGSSVVGAAVALVATITAPSLGVGVILLWVYIMWRIHVCDRDAGVRHVQPA